MAKDDNKDLWRRYKASPNEELRKELRNELIMEYLDQVDFQARRLARTLPNTIVDVDDLYSAGVFGLMDAIEAFDLNRGIKFQSFSALRIRGSMLDYMRQLDPVARSTRRKSATKDQTADQLVDQLGRNPTDDELADELGLTAKELALGTSPGSVSIETTIADGESTSLRIRDNLVDSCEMPFDRATALDQMRLITRSLSQDERCIVLMYWYEGMTMKSIGRSLGVSESRVSQLHSGIVARLEGALANRRDELFER